MRSEVDMEKMIMETIKFKTHIGSDGILKLEMPIGASDVDADVVVIYTVQPTAVDEDWQTFINRTYGILADDPIERPTELSLDVRDDIG
jgi:hypothetical protein